VTEVLACAENRDWLSHAQARSENKPLMNSYDVFISHASEDKEAVAAPLANELKRLGYNVWLDKFTLRLGDVLSQTIEHGLAQSRFGVVILSRRFFAKNWPMKELSGLVGRETAFNAKVILPIWHELTHAEVAQHSPTLADRLAVHTSAGLDVVAAEIAAVLGAPETSQVAPLTSKMSQLAEVRKKQTPKKAAPRKLAPKKTAPRKLAAKKAAPRKLAAKKAAPRKLAAKKAAPRKLAPKKAAAKKLAAKKPAVKTDAERKELLESNIKFLVEKAGYSEENARAAMTTKKGEFYKALFNSLIRRKS
jgi:NACalpha-BTF3-like transcription factor